MCASSLNLSCLSSLHLSTACPPSISPRACPPSISPACPPTQPQQYDKLKFFKESEVYWAPANTTSGLYNQLSDYKYREIPRNQIM